MSPVQNAAPACSCPDPGHGPVPVVDPAAGVMQALRKNDRMNMNGLPMNREEQHSIPDKTYIFVWIGLLILTGVTIKAAQLRMGAWSMFANIAVASTKASLVLWFFMHLKYEKLLFKLLLLVPVITIGIIIGMTFFDIWFR
jgi:cytochrome c oxidase subunit IV